MAKWKINPKYYIVAAVVSFAVASISFWGVVLKNDGVGRLIFGSMWLIFGVGWLGQYFHRTTSPH